MEASSEQAEGVCSKDIHATRAARSRLQQVCTSTYPMKTQENQKLRIVICAWIALLDCGLEDVAMAAVGCWFALVVSERE